MPPKKATSSLADDKSSVAGTDAGEKKSSAVKKAADRKAKAKKSAEERASKAEKEKAEAKAAKARAAEERAEAAWQVQVAARLSTLTGQVSVLDPEILANVTEALKAADEQPKNEIMEGKLKIEKKEENQDVSAHKEEFAKLKKKQSLYALRAKIEGQYKAGNVDQTAYTERMKEIKELENNPEIDWLTFTLPQEDELIRTAPNTDVIKLQKLRK